METKPHSHAASQRGNQKYWKKGRKLSFHSRKQKENDEIQMIQEKYDQVKVDAVSYFSDLPLSKKTLDGLTSAGYTQPTDIQRESIGFSLKGCDILGAAKTGSGKTLAFLIPILEALWRARWTRYDGLGALIISPTRELAYQTFDVLRKIGGKHNFSAGLVIGGKNVKEEKELINATNIVICTPGRLLQHMDQTYNFSADGLKILVLDEADRILDLGFRETMNAIFQNLPHNRQTLLYSATQTQSVEDLACVSLKNPMLVSVHERAEFSTPHRLQQSYIVCELHDKLNLLWSFVKHHLKSKILVFLSSCKQTRFVHEAFRRLRPGVTVLALHGAMNQLKRVAIYDQFCRKSHAVLFATDIAARGLDFPAVNWVIQMDCPEDASTYIHRAGRTARYEKDGEALLFLLPSEVEAMVVQLQRLRIPIANIRVNPKRHWPIDEKLRSLLAADVQLKDFAQKAFVSYIRSVFLMKNKAVFDVRKLDTSKFSSSLGLALPPRIRFLNKGAGQQTQQSTSGRLKTLEMESLAEIVEESPSSGDDESDFIKDRRSSKTNPTEDVSDDQNKFGDLFSDNDDTEDMFTIKRDVQPMADSAEELLDQKESKKLVSKGKAAKKLLKKGFQINTKIKFDESGERLEDPRLKQQTVVEDSEEDEDNGLNIEAAKKRMKCEDVYDKELDRQRVKRIHAEERLKEKEKRRMERQRKQHRYIGDDDDEVTVALGAPDEGSEDSDRLSNDSEEEDANTDEDDNDEEQDADDSGTDYNDSVRVGKSKRRKISDDTESEFKPPKSVDRSLNSVESDEAMAASLLAMD